MNDFTSPDRDVNRAIQSWLHEDRHEDASRIAGIVLDEVAAMPRRRAFPWPARRTQGMNRIIGFGLAAAVVIAVLFAGAQLFATAETVGGPGPDTSPTAHPTTSPEASTATAAPSVAPEGLLPQGPHVLTDGGPIDGFATLPMTVTIPAPDWYGEPGDGILIKNDQSGAPNGAGLIVFFGDLYVYGDPCRWSTTRPNEPATTVDELVAALTAQASREATPPVDVTVDGYAGKSITLHVPQDADFSQCDSVTFGSWGLPGPDESPFRYHQDPGQIDRLWILDVNGTLTVIDAAYYEGTPQSVVDELEAIVDSTAFD